MLGAIFPDSDVLRDMFSHDKLLIVTWHRSITHSLILLPLWSLLLAWVTHAFCKWRKWEAPSFTALSGIYAVGILSHILLDLVTTFGTMIWSPLEWSRPAWDMIFIVDFTLSGILLAPQLLAWIYSQPEKMWTRALRTWLVFLLMPLIISRIAEGAGAPVSGRTVLGAMMVITAIFLLPLLRGWGLKCVHRSNGERAAWKMNSAWPKATIRESVTARSKTRVDWFALESQHSENTLVNSAQWFLVNEPLQRLQSQGKLPKRERSLCAQTSAL